RDERHGASHGGVADPPGAGAIPGCQCWPGVFPWTEKASGSRRRRCSAGRVVHLKLQLPLNPEAALPLFRAFRVKRDTRSIDFASGQALDSVRLRLSLLGMTELD